jgi:hypothetical protein
MSRKLVAGLAYLMVLACDDPQKPEPVKVEEPIRITPTKTEAEAPKPSPAQLAEEESAKAQAAVEANPLTPCCRALSKMGFMQRSPDFIAASEACGAAMAAKKSKAEAKPAIKKALGKEGLPSECD